MLDDYFRVALVDRIAMKHFGQLGARLHSNRVKSRNEKHWVRLGDTEKRTQSLLFRFRCQYKVIVVSRIGSC